MNTFTEKELLRLSKSLNNKMNLIQEDTPGRTWGDTATGMWHKITDIGNDSEIEGITKRRENAETELTAAKERLTTVTAEIAQLSPQKADPKVYANLTKLSKEEKELNSRIQYMTNRVNSYKKDEKEIMDKTPVGNSTPASAPAVTEPTATQPTPATGGQQATADAGGAGKPAGVKQSVKYTDFQNDTARPGLRKTGSAEVYDKQVKYNKENPDKPQITTDGIEGNETRTAFGMSATGTSGVNATKNNSSKTTSKKSSPARTSMIKQMQSDLGVRQSGDFDQETTNALISRPDVAASYGMRPPTPKPNRPASIAPKKPAEPAPFDYAQRFNETTTFSTVPTINRMRELAGLK